MLDSCQTIKQYVLNFCPAGCEWHKLLGSDVDVLTTTLSSETIKALIAGLSIMNIEHRKVCLGPVDNIQVEFVIFESTWDKKIILKLHVFAGDEGRDWEINWDN